MDPNTKIPQLHGYLIKALAAAPAAHTPLLARCAGLGNAPGRLPLACLRVKECDRIAAVTTELRKMGIAVEELPDALHITGGTPRAAVIGTCDDHRTAMCFAVAGLRTPGGLSTRCPSPVDRARSQVRRDELSDA